MSEGQPISPKEISAKIAMTVGEKVDNPLTRINNSLPILDKDPGTGVSTLRVKDPNAPFQPHETNVQGVLARNETRAFYCRKVKS